MAALRSRRWRAPVLAALAIGAIAAVLALARWARPAARATSPAPAPAASRPPAPPSAPAPAPPAARDPERAAPSVTLTPAAGATDPASRAAALAALDQTERIYRETMAYPLWSRPADGSTRHVTEWNRPIEVTQPFATDGGRREIEATARIDRVFAAPGAAVAVAVSARHVDDRTPARLDEAYATLQWRDPQAGEWITLQPVPLRGAGAERVGAVVPSAVPALRAAARETRIVAFVRRGDFSRELTLDFSYAAAQPVVVGGLAIDRVTAGHLELGLEVELAAAAPVRLMATLFAADGTALAVYDDRYFPTRAGRQVIPVRIFGKLLHDQGRDGPYRLGAIHGYVFRDGQTPDRLAFDRADEPPLITRPHRAAGFSAAPHDSPELAAQLARYEELRRALREGRAPAPPPPPPAP